jgi:hypothetical protein
LSAVPLRTPSVGDGIAEAGGEGEIFRPLLRLPQVITLISLSEP